jgi:hypothetical protein
LFIRHLRIRFTTVRHLHPAAVIKTTQIALCKNSLPRWSKAAAGLPGSGFFAHSSPNWAKDLGSSTLIADRMGHS